MVMWILVFSLYTNDGVFNDHIEFNSKQKCENAAKEIRKNLSPAMSMTPFRYVCLEK